MHDKTSKYITLGRSGLRVSPLSLGGATFNAGYGIGADENTSQALIKYYLDQGGNFIDTADFYSEGKSEQAIGQFIHDSGLRDRIVLGTKFTMNADKQNPNAGGNSRKNIRRALEGSLRRLQTDYIDIYWLHLWDIVTPIEEVVSTLNDLIREGKILYYGFSNVPAWYATRAYSLAEQQGYDRPVALQLKYSLIERNIETEHLMAAQALGLAICLWSPLSEGFLSGKYQRVDNQLNGEGRLAVFKELGHTDPLQFSEKDWEVLDMLITISNETGKSPAQIALNWLIVQKGVTSITLGAKSISQLQENMASLSFELPDDIIHRLTAVSQKKSNYPYNLFNGIYQDYVNGGHKVEAWSPATI